MMPDSTDRVDSWMRAYQAFTACARLAESAHNFSQMRLSQVAYNEAANKPGTLPSFPDFLVDFEQAAAVLDRWHFIVFRAAYLNHRLDSGVIPAPALYRIQMLVGSELIRRGIYSRGYFYDSTAKIRAEQKEGDRLQRIAVAKCLRDEERAATRKRRQTLRRVRRHRALKKAA